MQMLSEGSGPFFIDHGCQWLVINEISVYTEAGSYIYYPVYRGDHITTGREGSFWMTDSGKYRDSAVERDSGVIAPATVPIFKHPSPDEPIPCIDLRRGVSQGTTMPEGGNT